jgi:hypothetical protein
MSFICYQGKQITGLFGPALLFMFESTYVIFHFSNSRRGNSHTHETFKSLSREQHGVALFCGTKPIFEPFFRSNYEVTFICFWSRLFKDRWVNLTATIDWKYLMTSRKNWRNSQRAKFWTSYLNGYQK